MQSMDERWHKAFVVLLRTSYTLHLESNEIHNKLV